MEYINANGTFYKCKTVTTGINNISFVLEGQNISEIKEVFGNVTSLTVQPNNEKETKPYGFYENLVFYSATEYANGDIGVTMHIKSEMEIRMEAIEARQDNIEASQEIQDEAIAEVAEIVSTSTEDIEAIKAINEIQDEAIVELADVIAGGE